MDYATRARAAEAVCLEAYEESLNIPNARPQHFPSVTTPLSFGGVCLHAHNLIILKIRLWIVDHGDQGCPI